MKKILLSLSMILFALAGYSQQAMKTVQLDSLVSVNLPADFQKLDTLGQQSYSGASEYGYIMISRTPNPANKTLKKEKDLNNVFKEYIRKVQASLSDGTITNDHDTIINKLEVREFTLRTDTGSGVQLRRFRILYTQPVTYTFQYLYDEARQDVAGKEMNTFFASIKTVPTLDGGDQYATFGQSQGISGTTIVFGISGLVIIIFIVIMVRRKRRHDMMMRNFTGR